MRISYAGLLLLLAVADAGAQTRRSMVVRDSVGAPISFATVVVKGGATRVTDTDGKVDILDAKDSLTISVRRIGYREFQGKVGLADAESMYEVTLLTLPQVLGRVSVSAKREAGVLERRGYYERMLDSQKGRFNGEYYTPEMLESANAGRVSQLLNSSKHARVESNSGLPVIRGRRQCVMSIFVDGQLIKGVYEGGRSRGDKLTIDDLVSAGEVAAIEIYPHVGNAPSMFQLAPGNGSCGLVAIWTGGR